MMHSKSVWEDLVNDFLEIGCFLTEESREFLLQELRCLKMRGDWISVHPTFSIGGRVIVVCDEKQINECWFYDPKGRKIEKIKIEEMEIKEMR